MQQHAVKLSLVTDALGMQPLRTKIRRRQVTVVALCSALASTTTEALARPNTHGPAISTWDTRASSVVLALGRAVSGDGGFTHASYNANFSSTSGFLSAQFGAHYVTYRDADDSPTARGVSAGGVALMSLPLSERYENGVPGSSFAFYLGVVPTALYSGQLNFISVPLVIGLGLPFSPSRFVTFRPWVELSPGFNFDTRIQAVSTASAVEAAMDGTLTRAEVEELVEQGLGIDRESSVGKRAGLSFAVHLGERVDMDMNLVIGEGHSSAVGLGAALVFRWDAMVPGVLSREQRLEGLSCAAVEERFRSCRAARGGERRPGAARPRRVPAATRAAPRPATERPGRAAPPQGRPAPAANAPAPRPPTETKKKRRPAEAAPPSGSRRPEPAKPPSMGELPPLQAAPPRPR